MTARHAARSKDAEPASRVCLSPLLKQQVHGDTAGLRLSREAKAAGQDQNDGGTRIAINVDATQL